MFLILFLVTVSSSELSAFKHGKLWCCHRSGGSNMDKLQDSINDDGFNQYLHGDSELK